MRSTAEARRPLRIDRASVVSPGECRMRFNGLRRRRRTGRQPILCSRRWRTIKNREIQVRRPVRRVTQLVPGAGEDRQGYVGDTAVRGRCRRKGRGHGRGRGPGSKLDGCWGHNRAFGCGTAPRDVNSQHRGGVARAREDELRGGGHDVAQFPAGQARLAVRREVVVAICRAGDRNCWERLRRGWRLAGRPSRNTRQHQRGRSDHYERREPTSLHSKHRDLPGPAATNRQQCVSPPKNATRASMSAAGQRFEWQGCHSSRPAPNALIEDRVHGATVVRSVEVLTGVSLECPATVLASERSDRLSGPASAWLERGTASGSRQECPPRCPHWHDSLEHPHVHDRHRPHKGSHTAAVLDEDEVVVGELRVELTVINAAA